MADLGFFDSFDPEPYNLPSKDNDRLKDSFKELASSLNFLAEFMNKPLNEQFEELSPFNFDSNSYTRTSCNRVPGPGDFYAMRNKNPSCDRNGAQLEYFLFKKDGNALLPMTFKELKNSDVMKHLKDDCKNFRDKVLQNENATIVLKVVCGDKVATFGGKKELSVKHLSRKDRLDQRKCSDKIKEKILEMYKSRGISYSFRNFSDNSRQR